MPKNNSPDIAELEKAYIYCQKITKFHAKSFYFAAKFLPKSRQPYIYALYALCRHLDDEIDEAAVKDEQEAIKAVKIWQAKLNEIYLRNSKSADSILQTNIRDAKLKTQIPKTGNQTLVLLAWQHLLTKYKIPSNLPLDLIKGVLMDTHIKHYETFDDLYVYCYRVASTVGLMSSEILGYTNPEAPGFAEALGIGMQLTNILRDIREDAEIGRIYLPQEDLHRFDVTEEQILAGRIDDNFIKLMKFEIKRARSFYQKGEQGIPLLEKSSRFAVLLASRLYSRILDEIERQNYDVFIRRAHTTTSRKMLSIPQIWFEARNL